MLCPICYKKEGEWQCQVCKRIVCADDARPTGNGVFCVQHAPQSFQNKQQSPAIEESESVKSVKSAFFTVLFLTLGMAIIGFVGQQFVQTTELPENVQDAIKSLTSVGITVISLMGVVTLILGVAYFAVRKRK